jgi:flagellar protein FlaJ
MKISLPSGTTMFIFLLPFLSAGMTYLYYYLKPGFVSKNRARKIELHMPYALNFIAAMSSAGITPAQIFESLSRQEIYGEIRNEALLIYRDMKLLGKDIISAMRDAMERSPSKRFRDFLQGAVVTVTSGGSLKSYFSTKSEQYMRENKQIQRKFNETLATMAESYVTAAVAGPLMILIIIPLMMFMSSGGGSQLLLMYLFIFFLLPLIHLGFVVVIKSMTPEV